MKHNLIVSIAALASILFIIACVQSPEKPQSKDSVKGVKTIEQPAAASLNKEAGSLEYTAPGAVEINSADLKNINAIVSEAIHKKAAPSIALMIIKDAKVIFSKAYGTHTYIDDTPTKTSDIYDLASITKISATTLAAMRLYEEGKIKLDATVGEYIPEAVKTNKSSIRIRELLLHEAGLVPQIPFHLTLTPKDYRRASTPEYPTKVADNYFLRRGYYKEVMWPEMLKSTLGGRGKYVYSDLSMYFMKEIIERQSGKRLEDYLQEHFYKPLGMSRTGFNPRKRFAKDEIIPTEHDGKFRKSLLQGYVHDEGAALAGGVSGHAGLFASTNDLGILFQMLLNRGTYDGKQYFKPETVDIFTAKQSAVSHRGLGFDRWDPESVTGFPSKLASPRTYGHTGFTGTCVWIDPEYNLIYIFLSNRVNPDRSDKLNELNIRVRIHDVIYRAIIRQP